MATIVYECVPGEVCRPTTEYRFRGRFQGFYLFETEDGYRELFARHRPGTGDASWHLRRGAYVYEFCKSVL